MKAECLRVWELNSPGVRLQLCHRSDVHEPILSLPRTQAAHLRNDIKNTMKGGWNISFRSKLGGKKKQTEDKYLH